MVSPQSVVVASNEEGSLKLCCWRSPRSQSSADVPVGVNAAWAGAAATEASTTVSVAARTRARSPRRALRWVVMGFPFRGADTPEGSLGLRTAFLDGGCGVRH